MSIAVTIAEARRQRDLRPFLEAVPYARFLGLEVEVKEERLLACLPYARRNLGNPNLPALHGGVVASFLELTGALELLWSLESETVPKSINITVDYLRPARALPLFASGIITKPGRRVASVRVEAWQDDPARPVAHGHAHYLVVPPT